MPVPYMGSKRKSAQQIKNIIKAHTKKNKGVLVDLFCGGFAISEEFIKDGRDTISNDKNKYVVALIDQTINKGLDEEKCLEWVSREKFKDVINNPDKYEDWYVGYVMCIWSFGNNQKAYMFGKDIEEIKKSFYNLVVNKDLCSVVEKLIQKKYIEGIIKQKDWHTRRIALSKVVGVLKKKNEKLKNDRGLESLQILESLQRLERLQSLERLQRLNNITISSLDYRKVEIPKDAVVYCDPPYQGTAEYKEGAFNHKEFREYMREVSKTNKVFISEYSGPDDFDVIYEFPQKSLLSGKGSTENKHTEKVFTYNR